MLEKNKIYCIDVMEGLKQLDDESVDLIITSPPYNKNGLNGSIKQTKNCKWTKSIDYGGNSDVDNDVYSYIQSNGNKLIYFKNFTVNKSSGTYVVYDLKTKKRETIDDVMVAFNAGNNSYFVLKDFSVSSKSSSLYNYKNEKFTKIEYNVTDFLYSE